MLSLTMRPGSGCERGAPRHAENACGMSRAIEIVNVVAAAVVGSQRMQFLQNDNL